MWLSDHANPDFKIMAAEHFEQGGALVEAAQHYELAAEAARLRGAVSDARGLLQHAVTASCGSA